MFGQSSLPQEKASLSFQVPTGQDALSLDVASHRSIRFLWTGLGFAALMLIGVAACALAPLASYTSAKPCSREASAVAVIFSQEDAFIPYNPLLVPTPGDSRPATSGLRARALPGVAPKNFRAAAVRPGFRPSMSGPGNELSDDKEVEESTSLVESSFERPKLPGEGKNGLFFKPPLLNLAGQALFLYPILTNGLLKTSHFDDPKQWIAGVLAAIPLLVINRGIEFSESPAFAQINAGTKAFALDVFGSKAQPLYALALSIAMALSTGVVEETVYRGAILPEIQNWAVDHSIVANGEQGIAFALLASSLGFGVAHAGLEFSLDTATLVGLQTVTGLFFGSTYILTGGLAAPIITHLLYDLYILYETHLVVTDQVAFADKSSQLVSAQNLAEEEAEVRKSKGDKFVDYVRRAWMMMDTNRDGNLSVGEFRMAFYAMGTKVNEAQFQSIFKDADANDNGKIEYNEFLRFLMNPKSAGASDFCDRFERIGVAP